MDNEIFKWLSAVFTSLGITGVIGLFWRDSIGRFFTKSVDYQFEKKMEKFKSDIRGNEKELEQMRAYLSSARSGRDALLQRKKFESAENLIKARRYLNEFNLAVTYMQMFKIEAFYENINDPKIQGVIDALIKPLKLDEKAAEYKNFDLDTPRLYLSDKTMKVFDVYSGIVMISISTLKMLEVKDKGASNIVSYKNIIKDIIDLLPHTKEGFEKHGDSFAFQFHGYFRRELLTEIKNELTGDNTMVRDTELAAELALGLRNAQVKVKETIAHYNIPDELINTDAKMV